eukprot:CAMPEP_0176052526 /NCGR_PEP_ID=MMETSP0120_2-20121206/26116_1 /TAXON_ID=160619 /ORGANISM="Kryptoperidinium foliaceum, Strain CCMP 1326" /LENGTH=84 /DNA_ID=CAMNT_0017385965 /DNA_START=260 /DNA_END=515 /DNA_ORIENTATION=+
MTSTSRQAACCTYQICTCSSHLLRTRGGNASRNLCRTSRRSSCTKTSLSHEKHAAHVQLKWVKLVQVPLAAYQVGAHAQREQAE